MKFRIIRKIRGRPKEFVWYKTLPGSKDFHFAFSYSTNRDDAFLFDSMHDVLLHLERRNKKYGRMYSEEKFIFEAVELDSNEIAELIKEGLI